MPFRIIQDAQDLADLALLLGGVKLPVTVQWVQGKNRTDQQNALQWMWAGEAAAQRGDVTAQEVQREWKLQVGVPILRAENPMFRKTYDLMVKPHPYEDKLDAMDNIEVSSVMKLPQMIAYMDEIQRRCASVGIHLTEPDRDLAKYQARYRQKEDA